MKTAVGFRTATSFCRVAVGIILPIALLQVSAASSTDYLFDEGELAPREYQLSPKAEAQADALAHFVTGIFQEESAGPEKALASYRRVLAIDPGFSKLAIEVAYDCLRRGEATEAIGVLKDAIKARPNNPEPALALSSIYLRHLRKPDLAVRYAETALKAAPAQFAPYQALWEIAQTQGDVAAGQRVIVRALKARATTAEYWLQVAEFLTNASEGGLISGERFQASLLTCLDNAAKFAGDDAPDLARIGDFNVIGRRLDEAAKYYFRASDLKPTLPNINERLAGALIELGRKDEAIPVLERLIAANPLDVRAYDQLYRLYDERGDYDKALKNVEQALIIDKGNLARQRDLMLLLLRTNRIEETVTRAAEARQLFPRLPFFTYVQARALTAAGRSEAALPVYETAVTESLAGDSSLLGSAFYFDYGCAAQLAGRREKAEQLFRKSIELDPKNPDAYNSLAYMWIERGENLSEAEKLVRQALALDPANGAYIDSLGWLYFQKKDFGAALDELLRAAKALPEPDAVVFEHIGDTYRALNRTAEALLYWQKAVALDAGNKPLLEKIDQTTARVAAQQPAEKR